MLLPSSENTSKSYGENHVRIAQEDMVMVRERASGSGTESAGLDRKRKIRLRRGNAPRIIRNMEEILRICSSKDCSWFSPCPPHDPCNKFFLSAFDGYGEYFDKSVNLYNRTR